MHDSDKTIASQMIRAIAWCLAWGNDLEPEAVAADLQSSIPSRQNFEEAADIGKWLNRLSKDQSKYWTSKIGLVYGGATKIKQYVFESADLQEIRGASALLDRINLIDLPAFFHCETDGDRFPQCHNAASYCRQVQNDWLHSNFPSLENALIPEMVIYSTGGNILAFCPAELVDDLANAIEKRYTTETLTANACAVGDTFYPLEIFLGLLAKSKDSKLSTDDPLWIDTIQDYKDNPAVRAYFSLSKKSDKDGNEIEALSSEKAFTQRKGFSELVGKLANQFNQRRSGYDAPLPQNSQPTRRQRPSLRYPPMFETHPYLMRDDSDRRSAVAQIPANQLPDIPKLSEPTARKRIVGQTAKRENFGASWYLGRNSTFRYQENGHRRLWKPGPVRSWVNKFEAFLTDPQEGHLARIYDPDHQIFNQNWKVVDPFKREARALTEIGDASKGFVAYIYADGNNMGQYIRDQIKTPEDYQRFSQDIFEATEQSVYWALAHHVHPHHYKPDAKSSRDKKDPVWIHPFEIITIGGDDVLLVVPANTALRVAHAIGQRFEQILQEKVADDQMRYGIDESIPEDAQSCHRYQPEEASQSECCLSISSGVLITAANTPIYYADKLVSQLLKSAKKKAKTLRDKGYYSGTVDVLTLKAVTMISSDIESFRQEGLTVRFQERKQDLKLYAAPFTLHELDGLIKTIQAVKSSGFPKSQLYQVRSLLERGKRTAILNYRYFKVRLQKERDRRLLTQEFENAWCQPLDENNPGNLAPWMTAQRKDDSDKSDDIDKTDRKTIYETIWRELVELYPFIDPQKDDHNTDPSDPQAETQEVQR